MRQILVLLVLVCGAMPSVSWAEGLPMTSRGSLLTAGSPLFQPAKREGQVRSASLFAGRAQHGLFAPPDPAALQALRTGPRQGRLAKLRDLIAQAEAGAKGYDAVQYGARIKPPGPPTALTVQQIYDWIDETPGQPHAIGRYQFIPPTLRRLVRRAGVAQSDRFTSRVQDKLADILLVEAGLQPFLAGELGRHAFMNNLAKIWAGLPNDTGKSHYDGYAGNKATMTWTHFDAQMARIFPG